MKDLIQVTKRTPIKLSPGLGEAVVYVVLWPNWLRGGAHRNNIWAGCLAIFFFGCFLQKAAMNDPAWGLWNYVAFAFYFCWFIHHQEEAEADLLVKLIKKRAGK